MSKNLGVSHNIDNVNQEGMILTLEDRPIINDTGKIDNTTDVLHNVNLRDDEIAMRNVRRRAKLQDTEDPFGDRLLLNPNNILSKYDDIESDLTKSKFTVKSIENDQNNGQNGQNGENSEIYKKSEIIRQKLKSGSFAMESLKNMRALSSDFMTRDEMNEIAEKAKVKGLKKRRKRNFDQNDNNDKNSEKIQNNDQNGQNDDKNGQNDGENGENSKNSKNDEKGNIFGNLDMKSKKFPTLKVISRSSRRKKPIFDKVDQNTQFKNLEDFRKEQRKEEILKRKQEIAVGRAIAKADFGEEDDDELQRVIENTRIDRIKNFDIRKTNEKIRQNSQNLIKSEIDSALQLEYNETEGFMQEIAKMDDEKLFKNEIEENEEIVKKEKNGEFYKNNEKSKFNENKNDVKIKTENEFSEPLVKNSISDALKLFKRRGLLTQKDRRDFIGRENDESPSFYKSVEKNPEIRLEYLDPKTGRPLTRKQAFRQISHIFHGRKPGDTKTAKQKRKAAKLRQFVPKASTETPLGLVSSVKNKVKAIGRPFVELDQNQNAALVGIVSDLKKFDRFSEGKNLNLKGNKNRKAKNLKKGQKKEKIGKNSKRQLK